MTKLSPRAYFPFLLVTLLAIGTVEFGYYCLDKFVLNQEMPGETTSLEQVQPALPNGRQAELQPGEKETLDYGVITQRNLFGPPPSPENTEPVLAEEELEATTLEIVLMGTIDSEGDDDGRAIILLKKDRSQAIYQVGDMVEGAVLKEIRRGRVILSVDGRDELLDISEARQYAENRPPALRRAPVVRSPSAAGNTPAPRVVTPLRRIVRPQAASAVDQVDQEDPATPEENAPLLDETTGTEEQEAGEIQDQDAQSGVPVEDNSTEENLGESDEANLESAMQ